MVFSQLGSSWFVSTISAAKSYARLRLFSLKKEVASPRLPIRQVRPILQIYSSTSLGMSKLITCITLGMSRPREATAVAMMVGI